MIELHTDEPTNNVAKSSKLSEQGSDIKNYSDELTNEVAKNATPPAKGDYIIWDATTRGFALRVYRESKVWIAQRKLGKRPVKVVIGRYPEMLCWRAT